MKATYLLNNYHNEVSRYMQHAQLDPGAIFELPNSRYSEICELLHVSILSQQEVISAWLTSAFAGHGHKFKLPRASGIEGCNSLLSWLSMFVSSGSGLWRSLAVCTECLKLTLLAVMFLFAEHAVQPGRSYHCLSNWKRVRLVWQGCYIHALCTEGMLRTWPAYTILCSLWSSLRGWLSWFDCVFHDTFVCHARNVYIQVW